MLKKKEKISANYLKFIPVYSDKYAFEINEKGEVTIFQENKGIFNKVAQIILKKPKVSQIHLDEMGNFIWPLIDGNRDLLEISELVKEHFGEKAEPLYNRLVQYIRTLEGYGFIKVNKAEG